ncbi:MAG TPA: hypothetical protein VFO34_10105 [Candidatus Acidoferrales bacterium]|nr:hypothetical protein [Candidatus Acidoferrales bacterium]
MKVSIARFSTILITALAFLLPAGQAGRQGGVSGESGQIVVEVTWDDANKTPATGVHIEAYGFGSSPEKSFVLKMVKAGQYEIALPTGVYDVFVAEASSLPRCKRVLVTVGRWPDWKLMLEHDDLYLNR